MPPLFMYSRPAKSRTIVRAPRSTALANASIRAGSLPPVTSPKMARTLAAGSSVEWTSTLVPGSAIARGAFRGAGSDRQVSVRHLEVVVLERHEVGQWGDPEDLAVVLGQP